MDEPKIPQAEIDRAMAEIAAHPLDSNQPDFPWVLARVQALGGRWGLNGKRGDVNNPSHDIFAYRWSDDPAQQPILVDTLIDGGGANGETFNILPWPEPAGAVWMSPGAPQPKPEPPPEPKPQPVPSVDLSAVLSRIDLMEKRQDAANEDARASILRLAESIEKFKMPAPAAVVFPEYESQRLSLLGTITLRPKK